jgi:hypothetical protein
LPKAYCIPTGLAQGSREQGGSSVGCGTRGACSDSSSSGRCRVGRGDGDGRQGSIPSECIESSGPREEGKGDKGRGAGEEGVRASSSVREDDRALRHMEEQHVHVVYDIIAQHFSATRCVCVTFDFF